MRQKRIRENPGENKGEARDRAYQVFYHLHKEGLSLKGGSLELRQQWDETTRAALRELCSRRCLSLYLLNTGNRGQELTRLPDEHYDWAVRFIKELLDTNFKNFDFLE